MQSARLKFNFFNYLFELKAIQCRDTMYKNLIFLSFKYSKILHADELFSSVFEAHYCLSTIHVD